MLSSIGVLLSVFKVPERFSPGTFDLLLNSHNLMHIMCVVGALPMHRAVMRDFQWLEEDNGHCQMYGK